MKRDEILLVGLSMRTSYSVESNPETGQIGATMQRYFQDGVPDQIPHRAKPGVTLCVYTDYESDYRGGYTYFIGEEVTELPDPMPEGLFSLTIPAQSYEVFTTEPGPMPGVLINAWQQVWENKDLEGRRAYLADFELYDERASDHNQVVLDLYIGLQE